MSAVDAVVAPVSRNSPCPCGSGRRYKDCHGLLGALGGTGSRSAYRAPGHEWAHLDDPERERFGAMMENALALQRRGRYGEAAGAYAKVVAAAPDTHDALHMLGVIELQFGNVAKAERLLARAVALRPAYAAIERNWQLVQGALDDLRAKAEQIADTEQLAERALPSLVELALARDAIGRPARAVGTWVATPSQPLVHLIGPVHAGADDDIWLLRRLADTMRSDEAVLWAVDGDGNETVGVHRVRRVDAGTGALPRGGTHVFAGVDFDCAAWVDRADADRVLVFCQSAAPTRYLDQLRAIARDGARPLELVFATSAMAERFGTGHAALPPLIELAATHSASTKGDPPIAPEAWPVGIVGQNQHFPSDPCDGEFVRKLGAIAGRLHIYDPGRFRYLLGDRTDTRFFERRPDRLQPFLAQLRCFVHRTSTWWEDTLGRELYGAMALGVPVLCPHLSIHAVRIAHGIDGFLYETEDEAIEQLAALRREPALSAAVGRAARAKMLKLFDADTQARRYRELMIGALARVVA